MANHKSEMKRDVSVIRSTQSSSRRDFLARSGATVVGAALSAASSRRVLGANDRIRLGIIGCGGMGGIHIRHFTADDNALARQTNTAITAVCDVYEPRKERAARISGGAQIFHNYQDLLSSGMVDAVIIATPEHWHYRQALDAAQAGVDVYLQKAMTRTFAEAKSLYQEISKLDCVFQLGSQYMRTPSWEKAKQLFDEEKLGHLTICQTSYCRNSIKGEWNRPHEADARPGENLDWKAWLGPLPYTAFKPDYFFNYRKYKPFSGGIITDLLTHKIHTLCYVVGLRFPKRVTALGGIYVHPDREVADTLVVTIEFEDFTMLVLGMPQSEVEKRYGSRMEEIGSEEIAVRKKDYDMLAMLDTGDPPMHFENDQNPPAHLLGHYPGHALAVKRRADELGVECILGDLADRAQFFIRHLQGSGSVPGK